jgi:putative ABC transport system permease protein
MVLGEQAILTAVAIPLGWALGLAVAAIIVRIAATDVFRFPLVVTLSTAAWCATVTGAAAFLSGWVVQRRVRALDLLAALKAPE